jgi:hypothetical protein
MNLNLPVAFAGVVMWLTSPLSAGEFPRFTVHRIDNFGRNIGQTALADVDKDGDLDWIAGNSSYSSPGGGEICWWEFQSADAWIRHPLGTETPTSAARPST